MHCASAFTGGERPGDGAARFGDRDRYVQSDGPPDDEHGGFPEPSATQCNPFVCGEGKIDVEARQYELPHHRVRGGAAYRPAVRLEDDQPHFRQIGIGEKLYLAPFDVADEDIRPVRIDLILEAKGRDVHHFDDSFGGRGGAESDEAQKSL